MRWVFVWQSYQKIEIRNSSQIMNTTEIIKLLPMLSIDDRIEQEQIDSQLRMAATLAVDDYTNDRELTIFTCLDGEDFRL
jgi:hypothetical protein